ncbi:MAG: bifunctional oligoribonuclease/PAP phosphatase NrnA [Desulfitobacteriaceae bacterium]
MSNSLPEMITELRKAPQVALFSHVSPDGDCMGSMLALGLALEKLNKQIYFFNPDPVPPYLAFLPGVNRVNSTLPVIWPEVLVFVDCTDIERTSLTTQDLPIESIVLNLDHHISNSSFGHINVIDPQASASGEMVLTLIEELGVELDKEIATNLYTAIVTDTGSFQYSNTTAQTHRVVAKLIDQKIELETIHSSLFDQKPLAHLKLLQRALASLQLFSDGQIALMILSNQDFIECGAGENLSEGLVNYARTIEGVEVAILIRERDSMSVKVALRSNLWLNVNEVAAIFQGGGHKRAAGCSLKLSLAEAQVVVLKAVQEALIGRSH